MFGKFVLFAGITQCAVALRSAKMAQIGLENIQPPIMNLMVNSITHMLKDTHRSGNRDIVIIGNHGDAGKILVRQLAAHAGNMLPESDNKLPGNEYFYSIRKCNGGWGLDGTPAIAHRLSDNKSIDAIFIDDAITTEESLREAHKLLKKEYNMNVIGSLFLEDKRRNTNKEIRGVTICTMFDNVNGQFVFNPKVQKGSSVQTESSLVQTESSLVQGGKLQRKGSVKFRDLKVGMSVSGSLRGDAFEAVVTEVDECDFTIEFVSGNREGQNYILVKEDLRDNSPFQVYAGL